MNKRADEQPSKASNCGWRWYAKQTTEWTLPRYPLQTYINSQRHLAAKAKETGATVLLSNHSAFDEAVKKNRMLAGRGNGPHPYKIGADWVSRYFVVTENCARATQLKLEQQPAR